MLNVGLSKAISDIDPIEFELPTGNRIKLKIQDAHINYSMLPVGVIGARSQFVYPTECRQRAATYKGKLMTTLEWFIDGKQQISIDKDMGDVPIMLKV